MKKSVALSALFAVAMFVVTSCATITSGTTQAISVSSNVQGAEVYLDGDKIGTTPFNGNVKKGKSTLRIEAPGHSSETLSLSKSLDPKFWGNIIVGGTLGSITDFASGAAYQYAPASYQVELRANGQSGEAYHLQLVVRKFAMIYIDDISRDLASGSGEHLSALVELINRGSTIRVTAREIRSAMHSSRGEPSVFGRKVVELL